MTDHTRRNFLKTASLGGAAVAAVAVLPAASAQASTTTSTAETGPAHDGSFAVWVKDAKSGEIAVLVGEREVIHHDRALARQLARIAARGADS